MPHDNNRLLKISRRNARKPRILPVDDPTSIAKKLGWSDKRLASFAQDLDAFREKATINTYVRLRRKWPDVEIQVGVFSDVTRSFPELEKQGINPDLATIVMHPDIPGHEKLDAIDKLCLRLMECLIVKRKLPNDGPGFIDKRRNAISQALINYLVIIMLEALEWSTRAVRIPSSLIMLIRELLCRGVNPDLRKVSETRRTHAAWAAAECLRPNERLTTHKLMAFANVGQDTAARYLADPEFRQSVKLA